ncbi:Tuberin [Ceratobasidium sp. AG-Ba]|nr:Tuberin [Ceratobasidium sp. AG-Ba]QRW08601.1 Tuberin [Ceratobasidium sp. AG-Ba]
MAPEVPERPPYHPSNTQREVFSSQEKTFVGPIVDWCNSLPQQKIRELRLNKSSGPPSTSFFLVLILEDGASYCLKRHRLSGSMLTEKDTIERISPRDLSAQRLFTVRFIPGSYPHLLSILSVCHAIQHVPSPVARVMLNYNELFAYVLFSNIVRRCLRPKDMTDYEETSLERLWHEVYLFVYGREYGFRESTMVDQTHAIVQHLLRIAAQNKLRRFANETQGDIQKSSFYSSRVSSTVAWLEASAAPHEPFEYSQWDRAWNKRWEVMWNQHWNNQLMITRSQNNNISLLTWSHLGISLTQPNVDGGTSGRSAGRFPVRVPDESVPSTPSGSVPKGSNPQPTSSVQPQAETQSSETTNMKSKSRHGLSNETSKPAIQTQSPESGHSLPPHVISIPTGTPRVNIVGPEANETPAGAHHTVHPPGQPRDHRLRPGGEAYTNWTTTCELAAKLGWSAAWDYSIEQGRNAAQYAIDMKEKQPNPEPLRKSSTLDLGNRIQQAGSMVARRLSIVSDFLSPNRAHEAATRQNHLLPPSPRNASRQDMTASPVEETPPPQADPPNPPNQQPTNEPTKPRSNRLRAVIRKKLITKRRTDQYRKEGQEVRESWYKRGQDQTRKAALGMVDAMISMGKLNREVLSGSSDDAWNRAQGVSHGSERHLDDQADREWTKRADTLISPLMGEEERREMSSIWKEAFKNTWKLAWKAAWEEAWESSWQRGWKAAATKAFEFGVDEILDTVETKEIQELMSSEKYKQVEKEIDQESAYSDCLSKLRSVFRELDQLHSILQQSIPMPHNDIMNIQVQAPKNSFAKLIEQLAEGSKEVAPNSRTVSHYEFQNEMEELVQEVLEEPALRAAFSHTQAKVWEHLMHINTWDEKDEIRTRH